MAERWSDEPTIVERPTFGWFVVVPVLAAAAVTVAMVIGPLRRAIQEIDDGWLDVMVDAELTAGVRASEALAFLGSVYVAVPLRLGVAVWLAARRQWLHTAYWLTAILLSEVAISALKGSFGRARPSLGLEATRSSAFPSGHSVAATVTFVALVLLFTTPGRGRRVWLGVAGIGAVVMALSRTYLRVHWLSDVVAGVVIGVAASLVAAWLTWRWRRRLAVAVEEDFEFLTHLAERDHTH